MGNGIRRQRSCHGDSRSPAAPQSRHHDPRRQLSAAREATVGTHSTEVGREGAGEVDLNQGVNSKCRPGVKTGCRLTFVVRVGEWGGHMLVDCDDPVTVHKFCSMLPSFVFEARPVIAVEEAVRGELEVMAWRDGLKGK